MSKYIKLEDALKAVRDNTMPLDCWHIDRMRAISSLPTIEVSEDCISRKATIREIEEMPNAYNGFSDTYDKAQIIEVIEEIPSVVPRLDKEDLEDIYEHIRESYIEGYMDGQADGVDAIGDCNICRFVGCSECDDCINGSQWVRMTKEDKE